MTHHTSIPTTDSLILLFQETRQSRAPICLADEWQTWLSAIAQVLAAFPTPARRWAAMTLVANDLVLAMPGLSLSCAFGVIARAVEAKSALSSTE